MLSFCWLQKKLRVSPVNQLEGFSLKLSLSLAFSGLLVFWHWGLVFWGREREVRCSFFFFYLGVWKGCLVGFVWVLLGFVVVLFGRVGMLV